MPTPTRAMNPDPLADKPREISGPRCPLCKSPMLPEKIKPGQTRRQLGGIIRVLGYLCLCFAIFAFFIMPPFAIIAGVVGLGLVLCGMLAGGKARPALVCAACRYQAPTA